MANNFLAKASTEIKNVLAETGEIPEIETQIEK